jgi:hypothetical protein
VRLTCFALKCLPRLSIASHYKNFGRAITMTTISSQGLKALRLLAGPTKSTLTISRHPLCLRAPSTALRSYATSNPNSSSALGSHRRAVTVANDDGRVRWKELSKGEKVARSTQQSFNFLTIAVGVVMTVSSPQAPLTPPHYFCKVKPPPIFLRTVQLQSFFQALPYAR